MTFDPLSYYNFGSNSQDDVDRFTYKYLDDHKVILDSEDGKVRFPNNAKQARNRTFSNRCIMMHPNVQNGTDYYRETTHLIAKEVFKIYEENGGEPTAELDQAFNLLTDMSQPCTPSMIIPDFSLKRLREELKLRDPDQEELIIINYFLDQIFSAGYVDHLTINKTSQSGPPFSIKRTKDDILLGKLYKSMQFMYIWENAREYMKAHVRGNYEVVSNMGGAFHYTQGSRSQSDRVKVQMESGKLIASGKDRLALEMESIVTFAEIWKVISQDFRVFNEGGEVDPSALACRQRNVFAASWTVNSILSPLNNFLYNGLKTVYAGAEYSGACTILDEVARKYRGDCKLLSLDKTQFGDTLSPVILGMFLEKIAEKDELMSDFVRCTFNAPTMYFMYEKGEKLDEPLLSRPLLSVPNKEHDLSCNFKSGNGLVAAINKIVGCIDAILVCRKLFIKLGIEFNLNRFLKNGYFELSVFNSGDDTIWICKNETIRTKLKEVIEDGGSLHKDKVETIPTYLGDRFSEDCKLMKDAGIFLQGLWASERGYQFKTNPELGAAARLELYAQNSLVPHLLEVSEFYSKRRYNFSYVDFASKARGSFASEADMKFAADPAVIMHKVHPMLVTRELFEKDYEFVDLKRLERIFKTQAPWIPVQTTGILLPRN